LLSIRKDTALSILPTQTGTSVLVPAPEAFGVMLDFSV
jgi:hypothetical protein